MARVARLNPRFRARLAAIGVVRGSDASKAVGRTIAAIVDAKSLPDALDAVAAMPPTGAAIVRRVPGCNVWLWFRVEPNEIVFMTASSTPPVPVE